MWTVNDYAVGKSKTEGDIEVINFTKGLSYILDSTFYKYEFEKPQGIIKGYTNYKVHKPY